MLRTTRSTNLLISVFITLLVTASVPTGAVSQPETVWPPLPGPPGEDSHGPDRTSLAHDPASALAVVVNGGAIPAISLIDPVTDTAYGPFLSGLLGAPGTELLDCVVTPDGATAIVSNFSARRLFFIDIRTLPPALLGSVSLPIPAEDIALISNGRFVLVTDGRGSGGFFDTTPITTVLQKLEQCENKGISVHNWRVLVLPKPRNHWQISSCNTVVLLSCPSMWRRARS